MADKETEKGRKLEVDGNFITTDLEPDDVLTDILIIGEYTNIKTGKRGIIHVATEHTGVTTRFGLFHRALSALENGASRRY